MQDKCSGVLGCELTGYIIGGELRQQGASMLAITAFVVAWVTVGIIQLPGEALMLGKRFHRIRMKCLG